MAAEVRTVRAEMRAGTPGIEQATLIDRSIRTVIGRTLKTHRRVLFGGDGYSAEWVVEAARRGLPNKRDTVEALQEYNSEKNLQIWTKFKVLSEAEADARVNIQLHAWTQQTLVEATVLLEIVRQHAVPAGFKHQQQVATSIIAAQQAMGMFGRDYADKKDAPTVAQQTQLTTLCTTLDSLITESDRLSEALNAAQKRAKGHADSHETLAIHIRDVIKPLTVTVRELADQLESMVDDSLWTLPKYSEMMFVK